MTRAADDRVELVAPDPSWAARFEAEAAALRRAVRPVDGLRIEHIGSTALANLRAKPIIDILLVHPEPALWPGLVAPITSLGYVFWSDNPRRDRMFFVKGMPPFGTGRTHHVHVRTPEDAVSELAFRDRLRESGALALEYQRLKERLALRFPDDREAYTEGKTQFVARVLATKGR
ncbi:MAG TPA: GrpB family protein [Burkholderiales bacterium]|nr:GrpB family protein [Burkholderiales bacterium]